MQEEALRWQAITPRETARCGVKLVPRGEAPEGITYQGPYRTPNQPAHMIVVSTAKVQYAARDSMTRPEKPDPATSLLVVKHEPSCADAGKENRVPDAPSCESLNLP